MTNCTNEPNKWFYFSFCEIYCFSLFGWRVTRGYEICLPYTHHILGAVWRLAFLEIYKMGERDYVRVIIFCYKTCTLFTINQNFVCLSSYIYRIYFFYYSRL